MCFSLGVVKEALDSTWQCATSCLIHGTNCVLNSYVKYLTHVSLVIIDNDNDGWCWGRSCLFQPLS